LAIIHQKDKRSGITYAYESTSHWDKEKKQSRSTRRLIGRVDPGFSHKYFGATDLLTQLASKWGWFRTCGFALVVGRTLCSQSLSIWQSNRTVRFIASIIGSPSMRIR